jgi:YD repeat-containing protein
MADDTYTVTEKNGLSYVFASNAGTTAGQKSALKSIKDRNGNALTLAYHTAAAPCGVAGNLCKVIDGAGRALVFGYAPSGARIRRLTDWTNRQFQYDYDANFNLTTYKSPLAVAGQHPATTYLYYGAGDGANRNHAMKRYTLPEGNGMNFEYYGDGWTFRHERHRNGAGTGETTTFRYNTFRRETVSLNERGFERHFFFDTNGNPVRIVEENGAVHAYQYDPDHPFNRTQTTGPEGLATQYAYDAKGNVTKITAPSGATQEFYNFTAFNQPQRIKDARGNWTVLKYDAKGNLLETLRLKTGVTPTLPYTPIATQIAAWQVNTYDAYGNLRTAKSVRNLAGQIASPTAVTGPRLTYAYDANSLYPIKITREGDKTGDGQIDANDPADRTVGWVEERNPAFQDANVLGFRKAPTQPTALRPYMDRPCVPDSSGWCWAWDRSSPAPVTAPRSACG